jgi:hypothetical protein
MMPAAPIISVNLAQSLPIAKWKPALGDFVIWHGWITHWFGIVSSINTEGTVDITKAGMPVLLFTMDELEQTKSKITVAISAINRSRGGKYAILQALPSATNVWYV